MVKLSGMSRLLDRFFTEGVEVPRCKEMEYGIMKSWSGIQAAEKKYKYRQWQLKMMGIVQMKVMDIIREIAGDPNAWEDLPKSGYEWVYNHHVRRADADKWSSCERRYSSKVRKLMTWPPFSYRPEWEVLHTKLSDLKIEPPPAMMLRVLECQHLELFNAYTVLLDERRIILLGSLWEMPPDWGKNTYSTCGRASNYFLGEWSLL